MSRSKTEKVIVVLPLEVAKAKEESRSWTRDQYIKEISRLSDKRGDKLLHLMDLYKANSLAMITIDQAREYYYKYILDIN